MSSRESVHISSRRHFLKTSAATATALSCGPTILGAEDKAGSKKPVLGVEGHKYEVHHNCMELPSHLKWMHTHGIAIDRAGLIYIKHRTMTPEPYDSIVVFDGDGKYVRSFGKEFHSGGHGIDIREEDGEEYLYLSAMTGQIAKMTKQGEIVWMHEAPQDFEPYQNAVPYTFTKGDTKYAMGKVFAPTNIAFAPGGDFYVSDGYGSHYVIRYNQAGEPQEYWGGQGSEPGKMKTPHGIWLDARGDGQPTLVVADRANARLQHFTLGGEHVSFVDDFLYPADIDIRGDVMLVPDLHARVTLLDGDNKVITQLGDDEEWRKEVLSDGLKMRSQPQRWQAGKFIHPHDACFDHDGNIYVAEWVSIGRVSFLKHVG